MSGIRRGRRVAVAGASTLLLQLASCTPQDLVGTADLPSDLNDPAATRTPAGAVAAYNGALGQFRVAFGGGTEQQSTDGYVAASGTLGDELHGAFSTELDRRMLPQYSEPAEEPLGALHIDVYGALHKSRARAQQALGLLAEYAPDSSTALRGHLFAIQGFSEVMLAELFCSGIPLSTLDYEGDFTLSRPMSTTEVLEHALALFDSALVLAGDSARILNLARLGRARALLGLGDVPAAALSVTEVPDGFRYEVTYTTAGGDATRNFAEASSGSSIWGFIAADREGVNGLDFRTSQDPRTAARVLGTTSSGVTVYHPQKYEPDGSSSIVLADWIGARLVESEAALQAGSDAWLELLNALRTDGTFTTAPNPDDPAATDTSWNAGSAGVAGLRPLADPGAAEARLDLLFRERASWLYLTGHRQGDLRRLIRQYGRPDVTVYPIGVYHDGLHSYGSDVTAPIPAQERVSNPLFTGCLSRGA